MSSRSEPRSGRGRRLLGTVVYVSDLAAAVRFYRDRLGLSVESVSSERATLRGGRSVLVLSRRWWPPTLSGDHRFAPTPLVEAADVTLEAKALEAAGVRVLLRPTPSPDGGSVAEVLDPDGNVVRLAARGVKKARRASARRGR